MKKNIALVLTVLSFLLITSSCMTSKVVDTIESSDTLSTENVIIRTISPFGGTDPSKYEYQEAIKVFEQKNPNIIVKDESSSSDEEWKTMISADFSAGNAPDVMFYFTGTEASVLIDKGFLISLDEIRTIYPDYCTHIKQDVYDQNKYKDGKNYSVPIRGFWEGLFINTDLFDKYNVTIPYDYNSFINAVDAFSKTDIVPIAASLAEEPHYWIEHLILSAGSSDDHLVVPTSPEQVPQSWINGLYEFSNLYEKGAFSEDVLIEKSVASSDMFIQKEAAMRLDGSWYIGSIKSPETTTVVPFYKMDGSATVNGIAGYSMGFFISKEAWQDPDRQQAAVKFVQEMTSKENIEHFAKFSGMSSIEGVEPDLSNSLVASGQICLEKFDTIQLPIDYRLNKESWGYLVNNIGSILDGSKTPEQILEKVAYFQSLY